MFWKCHFGSCMVSGTHMVKTKGKMRTLLLTPPTRSHHFLVCICSYIQNHIFCDVRRGLREYFPTLIQIYNHPAPRFLCTCTQTGPLLCCTQTAPRACRHWQLPVVSFPQVPGVTQPLPDRSNHRQGLFHSHPRVKAQRVPKEMTETYKSIALFFSSFLTLFWMQVWGLITVAGKEVDFTWPGSHQKEKSLHRDRKTQPCINLEDCHATPENSWEPNHTPCQNGENIWHSLLTAFQWGFIITKLLLAVPSPPMLLNYQPLGLCLCFSPPGTLYTNATHWISVYPSSPAQISFYLWRFPWMISSKISLSL